MQNALSPWIITSSPLRPVSSVISQDTPSICSSVVLLITNSIKESPNLFRISTMYLLVFNQNFPKYICGTSCISNAVPFSPTVSRREQFKDIVPFNFFFVKFAYMHSEYTFAEEQDSAHIGWCLLVIPFSRPSVPSKQFSCCTFMCGCSR